MKLYNFHSSRFPSFFCAIGISLSFLPSCSAPQFTNTIPKADILQLTPSTASFEVNFPPGKHVPSTHEMNEFDKFLALLPLSADIQMFFLVPANDVDVASKSLSDKQVDFLSKYAKNRINERQHLHSKAINITFTYGRAEFRSVSSDDVVNVIVSYPPTLAQTCNSTTFFSHSMFATNDRFAFGCASAANLLAMVANSSDVVTPYELGPADGIREAEAVLRYRNDKVKPLIAEVTRQ